MSKHLALQDGISGEQESVTENDTKQQFESVSSELEYNPLCVGLRFRLDQVAGIDTVNQRYTIIGILDIDWIATKDDIKNANDDEKKLNWLPTTDPKFEFRNAVEVTTKQLKFESGHKYRIMNGIGKNKFNKYVSKRIEIHGIFTEAFEVENFPFDVQDLTIVLESAFLPLKNFVFEPTHTREETLLVDCTYLSLSQWNLVNQCVEIDFVDFGKAMDPNSDSNELYIFSAIYFRLQAERKSKTVVVRIIVWMFLLGLLSFCMFSIPYDQVGDRVAYSITLVLAIIAFQFVISASLPQVPYLTLIDKYNFFVFLYVMGLSLEAIIVGWNDQNNQIFEIIDKYCIVIFIVAFIIGHIYWFFLAKHKIEKEKLKIGKSRKELIDMEIENGNIDATLGLDFRPVMNNNVSSRNYYGKK